MTNVKGKPKSRLLSTPFHKYDHVCGEGFSAQTRRERRAYPSGVCKARATTSGPKRTAARRVASLFGSGVVAPRSSRQVGTGDAPSSRLARTEKRRNKRGRIYKLDRGIGYTRFPSPRPSPSGRGRMVHRLWITTVPEFAQQLLAEHPSEARCSLSLRALRERVRVRGKYSVADAECSLSQRLLSMKWST